LPEAVQRFDTSARHRSLVSDSLLVRDPMRIEAQQSGRALAPMQRRRLRSPQRRRPPTSAFWATLTGNTDPLLPSSAVTIVSAPRSGPGCLRTFALLSPREQALSMTFRMP